MNARQMTRNEKRSLQNQKAIWGAGAVVSFLMVIGGILASEDSGIYYVSDYDNGYIFRVIDRKEVVLEESRELIDKYHQMLINERQQAILRNWAATITDIYKIKDLRY